MTSPVLSDEEKAHKVLEGQTPCVKCGEFWEQPGMVTVHDVSNSMWCIFCYMDELKKDLNEVKSAWSSRKNASGALSLVTGTDSSPMRYLTVLESMYGYRTRARLRNVRRSQQ